MRRLFLALVALAAGLTACSIDRRTSAFQCQTDADCDADRRCEEGYCTVGQRPPPDARPPSDARPPPPDAAPPPDAYVCPAPCTECIDALEDTCIIDCAGDNVCDQPIVCPPGMKCEIHCTDPATCTNTIDCSMAITRCTIECTGMGSCAGAITCPAAEACDVSCDGENSCAGLISCNTSCACDVDCTVGVGSCAGGTDCPPAGGNACDLDPVGCTSAPNQCDDC
jgi:hypothetical protein